MGASSVPVFIEKINEDSYSPLLRSVLMGNASGVFGCEHIG